MAQIEPQTHTGQCKRIGGCYNELVVAYFSTGGGVKWRKRLTKSIPVSDFIWPFLRPYMGVIPKPKMAFIFPISCILALIFPILIKYFPKCVGKGSFPKSQIKSLPVDFMIYL